MGERYPVFDAMRIAAALCVIISHSFALVGQPELVVLPLPGLPWTLGHFGVIIFFVTSGFLVTMSWQREPAAGRFALRRALRIWPAFLAVIVLAALVIGPLVTSLGTGAYLTDADVWGYILHNTVMSPITLNLPGVFTTHPISAVNGSIWTLPYEVLCYVGLVVLGVCRLVRLAPLVLVFAALMVVYRIGVHERTIDLTGSVTGVHAIFLVAFGVWFLAGMILAHLRHLVVGRHAVGAVALALTVVAHVTGESVLMVPALAVTVIYVGTLPVARAGAVRRWGDPSYGMYVWAWPVQQLVVAARTPPVGPWVVVGLSTVGAVAAGYASWHLVEARALRLSAPPDPAARPVPRRSGESSGRMTTICLPRSCGSGGPGRRRWCRRTGRGLPGPCRPGRRRTAPGAPGPPRGGDNRSKTSTAGRRTGRSAGRRSRAGRA